MGEKSARPDLRVAGIARGQYGVITIRQLEAAGLGRNAVTLRVQAGRLHRLYRGVYAVGHLALSSEGRWMAAVLACGKRDLSLDVGATESVLGYWGATLSHRSAAELWQLLRVAEGPIDVSVATGGGRKKQAGIRVHRPRALRPASVTLCKGIPVTTPGRTIADLRRASRGGIRQISSRELRRAVRQAGVLGLPIDAEQGLDRTRSDLERDFLVLCRRHLLPAPEVNVRIGPHLVDFLWRNPMLVVETDGYAYHRGRVAFEDDRARDLDLRARGFEVIRLAEKQVNEEPGLVAEVVGVALRVGADAARVR
jgi:very-short-patch-repair endonuclease